MSIELDAAIGRRMGLEPEIVWTVKTQVYTNNFSSKDGYGEQHAKAFADLLPGSQIEKKEHWPPLSSDMAHAWRMVEWMRGQGWSFSFEMAANPTIGCYARFVYRKQPTVAHQTTSADYWHGIPATAIALAMAAALGIEVEQEVKG